MRRAVILTTIALATAAQIAGAAQLKIATIAPDGSFWMNEARKAADEIAERTDGRVTFRFYPGGTMGDDAAVMRKMRIGQLHGGVFVAGSFASLVPDLYLYSLPLLFTSYDEVDAVREVIDPKLVAALEAEGYHSFGFIEGGFAYLYTTSKAAGFAELKGRKAWLPGDDPVGRVLIEEVGLSPVPLGLADVLTGLQTGLVDVVSGPPVAAVALQWFTKVKYVTEVPVVYTCGTFALSNRAWSKLSDGDQKVIEEVLSRMTRVLDRRAREDNEGAREALRNQGVVTVEPEAGTADDWRELADRSSKILVEELGLSTGLLAEIETIRDGVRSGE
ncbi:MAG: TRAP transporter substrate-binding protein DctP [Thermoanaerobaculales bacterium]|jgi:TRAP-type C4-dicarboxylate transport system substrate-binding protein|nr:TRAP transporter substrate-binding protein DctP [Thermoanaerobaculales bacterium]